MRAYAHNGRFWAEEGADFYVQLENSNFLNGIFFIYKGHLEIVTNVVVYTSTFVALKFAPLVTTYFSFSIQFIPIFLLILYRKELELSKWGTLALLIIATGLPQAAEVWSNSINLHFHFALVTIIIAAVSITGCFHKVPFRVLLAVSGLSGIPPNFIAPVFLILALKLHKREHWVHFLILTTTSMIQLAIILFSHLDTGDRQFTWNPLIYWYAILSQSLISPFLGIHLGDQLSAILKSGLGGNFEILSFAIFCSLPILILSQSLMAYRSSVTTVLSGSAFLLLIFSLLTALGDKTIMISAGFSGRYFYIPNIIWAMCFLILISKSKNVVIYTVASILLLSCFRNTAHYIAGPDWILSFNQAKSINNNTIQIWPSGWLMDLTKN